MNWHNEPWRKLYTRITGDWTQLSVMARGMSCELLKYAKDDGGVCKTRGKDPDMAIALVLGTQPAELDAVTEASRALREDGYLALRGDTIYIRNFGEAQLRRTPAAVRQRRYRENKKISLLNDDDVTRDITRDRGVTLRADNALLGSETRRFETNTEEAPAQKTARPKKAKSERSRWQEVLSAYSETWTALHGIDGARPVIDGPDRSALAKLYDKLGADETIALVKRFVSDSDPFIARRGHMLRDLPSRLNAYRSNGQLPIRAAAKTRFREPAPHAAETKDRTHEL